MSKNIRLVIDNPNPRPTYFDTHLGTSDICTSDEYAEFRREQKRLSCQIYMRSRAYEKGLPRLRVGDVEVTFLDETMFKAVKWGRKSNGVRGEVLPNALCVDGWQKRAYDRRMEVCKYDLALYEQQCEREGFFDPWPNRGAKASFETDGAA